MNLGINSNVERILTDFLSQLGIPRHIKGYGYVKYAIYICVENPNQIHKITKGLYPTIALKFETTPSRVERAVRHAIEIGWSRGNTEILQKIFGYSVSTERGKPTNSEFIATISDEIRLQLKK